MSRAKDPRIVKESQKVFRFIKIIGAITAVILIAILAHSLITAKDPDTKTASIIFQKQMEKATERDLGPYRKGSTNSKALLNHVFFQKQN